MHCPACRREVALAPGERLAFAEACPACGADLHVCRACAFHDPSAYNECREASAERVTDRDRANRCEYFRPRADGDGAAETTRADSLGALEALFEKD